MASRAAAQMCSGVAKSGSPTLKSNTRMPLDARLLALAAAARVADGSRLATRSESRIACEVAAIGDEFLVNSSQTQGSRGRGLFCSTVGPLGQGLNRNDSPV